MYTITKQQFDALMHAARTVHALGAFASAVGLETGEAIAGQASEMIAVLDAVRDPDVPDDLDPRSVTVFERPMHADDGFEPALEAS